MLPELKHNPQPVLWQSHFIYNDHMSQLQVSPATSIPPCRPLY